MKTSRIAFIGIFVCAVFFLMIFTAYRTEKKALPTNESGRVVAENQEYETGVLKEQKITHLIPFQPLVSMNAGHNLRDSLALAQLDDPRTASLINLASAACSANPDAYDATNPEMLDQTREWAIKRLIDLCDGFDPTNYKLSNTTAPNLVRILKRDGEAAAVYASLNTIENAKDSGSLFEAGQVLLETKKMPIRSIFPNSAEKIGPNEMLQAWQHAVTMKTCEEGGGCGSNTIQTAAFCANLGCRPDSSFESALQQRLPSSEYQATLAYFKWLSSMRSRH